MEIKKKHSTGTKSPASNKKGVMASELKSIHQEPGKQRSTLHRKNLSNGLEKIEQIFKNNGMQLDTTESQDLPTEINKTLEKIIVGRINAYRDTIYQALSAAFSNIIDNTKEIERINRIIADFLEARNGGSEISRIMSNLAEKHGKAVVSRREMEILTNLLLGKTNKEISRELCISEKTVKNHLWKIYRKLGVKNRTQLFHHLICP